VVAVELEHLFPYTVDLGQGEPIRVLGMEIESDLPTPGATWEELVDWLLP
jgi:hypothetical protein